MSSDFFTKPFAAFCLTFLVCVILNYMAGIFLFDGRLQMHFLLDGLIALILALRSYLRLLHTYIEWLEARISKLERSAGRS